MYFPLKTFGITAASFIALAACDSSAMMSESTMTPGGKNFAQMQAEYPDISAVEFSVLDDNDDGVISAAEEADIGTDEDELEVSNS